MDKNTQSILFLTDESDQPARIGFVITVGDVHYYLTRLKLAPHETRAINIAQLRDEQRPDFKGHKPRTAFLRPWAFQLEGENPQSEKR